MAERMIMATVLDEKIEAAATKKDTYLESLKASIEMCELVLEHPEAFEHEQLEKARKVLKETQENVAKREAIPFEQRL